MKDLNIEDLIPHRDRMKLIGEVIEVTDSGAVTASTVTEKWPLFADGSASPLVIIELVAQTAGVNAGWQDLRDHKGKTGGRGWIVGIKKARFHTEGLGLNARVITSSFKTDSSIMENYAEIDGVSRIGDVIVGEVLLQVFRPETGSFDFLGG